MLRVLGFLVVVVIAVLIIAATAALAIVVVRLIQSLLVAVAAALFAGGAIWLVAASAGSDDGLALGAAAALLALPLILWARSRKDQDQSRRFDIDQPLDQTSASRLHSQPQLPITPEPAHDHAVTRAWVNASELLARDEVDFAYARTQCALVLKAADEDGLSAELLDCAVLIRRHVPELVHRTVELMADATENERTDLLHELVESLNAIGRRSDELLAERRAERKSALSVRHFHVRRRR